MQGIGPSLVAALEASRPACASVFRRFHIPQQDHEDLLAAAALAAVTRWEEIVSPQAWLIGALRNRCRQYWRRHRRRPEQTGLDGFVVEERGESVSPQPWLRVDLRRAVSLLRPRQRLLLRFVCIEGHDTATAAARCGYKPSSGPVLMQRCRREVAAHLRSGSNAPARHPPF